MILFAMDQDQTGTQPTLILDSSIKVDEEKNVHGNLLVMEPGKNGKSRESEELEDKLVEQPTGGAGGKKESPKKPTENKDTSSFVTKKMFFITIVVMALVLLLVDAFVLWFLEQQRSGQTFLSRKDEKRDPKDSKFNRKNNRKQ